MNFVAIDFETANNARDSACSVGLVKVANGEIVATAMRLIRPPTRQFLFTYIHGLAWKHVANEPLFGEVWPSLAPLLEGAEFIAAHNAAFDRSVLRACCADAAIDAVKASFVCTVKVARSVWSLHPTTLADVCRHLRIPLRHHDAESDARACASILLAAHQHGHAYEALQKKHALKAARK